MAPLVDGKIYFALTLMNKEPRKISLTSALLFASLAILAPLARAQQCGCNLTTPTLNPIYGGGPNPCTYLQSECGRLQTGEVQPRQH